MSRDDRKGRDREGHKHSEKDRDQDRGDRGDRDRHRDRDRSERHREKERERERERERARERDREKLREKEREQERERERERERGRDRDRDRPPRDRDRDRNHDRGGGRGGGRDGGFPHRSRSRDGGPHYRRSTWRSDNRKPYRFDSPPRLDETEDATATAAAAFAAVPGAAAAISGVLTAGASALTALPTATTRTVTATGGVTPVVPGATLVQLDPATTKAARELYIGNLPPNVEVPQLLEFLNAAMAAVGGGVLPGPPAVKAWRSSDGHYAFVEFRTMEEASNAMQLNGLSCLGFNLRIGRPKTYPMELQHIVPAPTIPLLHPAGAVAGAAVSQITQAAPLPFGEVATVAVNPKAALEAAQAAAKAAQNQNGVEGPAQPDRLCVLGLPSTMPEEKIRQLVETFGPLKTFHVLKKDTDDSQLVCVIEYCDTDSQQQAMEILHTNSPYRVVTAEQAINDGAVSSFLKETISTAGSRSAPALLKPQVCTRVLVLHNIVTPQDLQDDDEYADIVEDIRIECEECGGRVVEVQVPRVCQDPCLDPRHIHDVDDMLQNPENGEATSSSGIAVKREEGGAVSGSGADAVKYEHGVKRQVKDEKLEKNDEADEMVTQEMILEALEGRTKVLPPMVGYAYVAFVDCEASANARKALNGRKFSGRVVEAHYFSELKFLQRAFSSPTPNFYKGHSCLHSPALAALVRNLKEEAAATAEERGTS
ncbi:hypothetical protein Esti_005437 [Eimeria stiedai]